MLEIGQTLVNEAFNIRKTIWLAAELNSQFINKTIT